MQLNRLFIIGFLFLGISQFSLAQFSPDLNGLVNPPASPEVAAFIKYGNTPVSLHSGTPGVSVPLGSVKGRSLEVPLNLTYDASGVKVEQIATWVGLGWNLNLGGAVTRMAQGLPDDYSYSQPEYSPFYSVRTADWLHPDTDPNNTNFFFNYFLNNQMFSVTNPLDEVEAYRDFILAKNAGKVDFQPDLYSFSIMGLSGTMYIDYHLAKGHCLERPDLKIEVDLDYVPGILGDSFGVREVTGWTITDNTGTVYEFKQAEKTEFDDHRDNGENGAQRRHYNSSWYCTKITTANGRDVVDFVYSTPVAWTNNQPIGGNESALFLGAESNVCSRPGVSLPTSSAEYKIWQFDLLKVRINGRDRIMLDRNDPASPREDLEGKSILKGIRVLNTDGSMNNHIVLDNDTYFTNGGSREWDKRLKLDGVRILGADDAALTDAELLQEYTFTYFTPENIPARDSYAQDYWGLYNGQEGNSTKGVGGQGTLIPAHSGYDFAGFTGADRGIRFDDSLTGTLRKITYPTGGETEFFFQPNYVPVVQSGAVNIESSYRDVVKAVIEQEGLINASPDFDPACGGLTDNTTQAPSVSAGSFTVEEGGQYTIHYTVASDDTSPGYDEVEYAFLYRGLERTFCELVGSSDDPDVLFWDVEDPEWYDGTGPTAEQGKKRVYLEAGVQYHMLVATNSEDVRLRVYHRELEVSANEKGESEATVQVGGFRVYKIVDRTDPNTVAKTKYYYYDNLKSSQLPLLNDNFFETNVASSGVLQVPLEFISAADKTSMNGSGTVFTCNFVTRSASNLYKGKSNIVTYSQVTETEAGGGEYNGFTMSEFYNTREATRMPYKKDLRNGKLRRKMVYNDDLNLLQSEEDVWETESTGGFVAFYLTSRLSGIFNMRWDQALSGGEPVPDSYGLLYDQMGATGIGGSNWDGTSYEGTSGGGDDGEEKVRRWGAAGSGGTLPKRCDGEPDCLNSGEQAVYEQVNYGVSAGWVRMAQQIKTTFAKSGSLEKVTNYSYDDVSSGQFNVRQTSTIDSEGDEIITRYTYPKDLEPPGIDINVYRKMVNANRVSEKVRTQRIKLSEGVETVLQEQETQFIEDEYSNDIVPEWLNYAINGGALEPRIRYLSHDLYGNPVWIIKDDVESVQYRWHEGRVPIVQVNGGYTPQYVIEPTTKQVIPIERSVFMYDGFEYASDATSSLGLLSEGIPSGKRYHHLGPNDLTGTKLDPAANYVMAFWAKGGTITLTRKPQLGTTQNWTYEDLTLTNEWKYYEFELTGVEGFTLAADVASIDEFRVHSKESQMTTYAYDEADRLITKVGPDGIPMHYEYDALGRLRIIRDHKGNILKLIKYGYKSVIND